MVVFSNAKINIGLNVMERRDDGFHNIETCYYPIPYTDILEIVPSDKVSFSSSGIPVPGEEGQNLCLLAYEQINKAHSLPPVSIHLHKMVPVGAGLGGGSANAAHCLKLLNQMFVLGITDSELERIAAQIGSDCPFFIRSQPLIGLGKGNRFETAEVDLSGHHLVIVTPPIQIPASWAYSKVDPKPRSYRLRANLAKNDVHEWKNLIFNDFEPAVFLAHPTIRSLKVKLYEHGAEFCLLSGSGSSVFGVFKSRVDLDYLDDGLRVWQGPL